MKASGCHLPHKPFSPDRLRATLERALTVSAGAVPDPVL